MKLLYDSRRRETGHNKRVACIVLIAFQKHVSTNGPNISGGLATSTTRSRCSVIKWRDFFSYFRPARSIPNVSKYLLSDSRFLDVNIEKY